MTCWRREVEVVVVVVFRSRGQQSVGWRLARRACMIAMTLPLQYAENRHGQTECMKCLSLMRRSDQNFRGTRPTRDPRCSMASCSTLEGTPTASSAMLALRQGKRLRVASIVSLCRLTYSSKTSPRLHCDSTRVPVGHCRPWQPEVLQLAA